MSQLHLWYTLGPSSLGKETDMFFCGATGVRLTFSFGTPEIQAKRATKIKNIAKNIRCPSYIVADLAGEKFRLGSFKNATSIKCRVGDKVSLMLAQDSEVSSEKNILPIPHRKFFSQIKKGSSILVGDGSATLEITHAFTDEATAEVISDGVIDQNRGLFIQGGDFLPLTLTDKDLKDLKQILTCPEYDAVALSFVHSESDLKLVRREIADHGRNLDIIAKIETLAGLENLNNICRNSDFVMAARGDLALSLPWVELPSAVNAIVSSAKKHSVPWILATQTMEGLERFSIPTRAEICDLANWLSRGCRGVLLSYETCFGSKPLDAVKSTRTIINRWGIY